MDPLVRFGGWLGTCVLGGVTALIGAQTQALGDLRLPVVGLSGLVILVGIAGLIAEVTVPLRRSRELREAVIDGLDRLAADFEPRPYGHGRFPSETRRPLQAWLPWWEARVSASLRTDALQSSFFAQPLDKATFDELVSRYDSRSHARFIMQLDRAQILRKGRHGRARVTAVPAVPAIGDDLAATADKFLMDLKAVDPDSLPATDFIEWSDAGTKLISRLAGAVASEARLPEPETEKWHVRMGPGALERARSRWGDVASIVDETRKSRIPVALAAATTAYTEVKELLENHTMDDEPATLERLSETRDELRTMIADLKRKRTRLGPDSPNLLGKIVWGGEDDDPVRWVLQESLERHGSAYAKVFQDLELAKHTYEDVPQPYSARRRNRRKKR